MEENISQVQPVEAPIKSSKPWLKITLFSILGLVLTGSLVFVGIQIGKRQAVPPSVVTSTSTPPATPPVDSTANWKTYKNSKYGFSFKYPLNWTTPENGPGDPNTITSKGSEGSVNIHLVEYFGGACPPEYEKTQIDNKDFSTCHYIREDKVEAWEQIVKEFDTLIGSYRGLQIDAYANIPTQANRNTVLKILSTFKFLD